MAPNGKEKLVNGPLHPEIVITLNSLPVLLLEGIEKENEEMVDKLYLKRLVKAFPELNPNIGF